MRIYANKIKNIITFTTKAGYYLELLIPDAMKLFGSTKSKIAVQEMCLIYKLLK